MTKIPLAAVCALLLVAMLVGGASARPAARPVSGPALLAIDRSAGFRNYLPTRMLQGFKYAGWSNRGGVLRVVFRNKAGRTLVWSVQPMRGNCATGAEGSYQLSGNKVWWATTPATQSAWRCVFGQDGRPLRLMASSTLSPRQLATVGLGTVAASAKRY